MFFFKDLRDRPDVMANQNLDDDLLKIAAHLTGEFVSNIMTVVGGNLAVKDDGDKIALLIKVARYLYTAIAADKSLCLGTFVGYESTSHL